MNHKWESRLPREISITSDIQMTPPLWQSKEKLKSFLIKVKEENEKTGLKTQHSKNENHGIWSYHFMENGKNGNGDLGKKWKQ